MDKNIDDLTREIDLLKKEKMEIENQLIDMQEKNLKKLQNHNIDPINDNKDWQNWVQKMEGKKKNGN